MRKMLLATTALATLLGSAVFSRAADPVTLRYKMDEGTELHGQTVNKMEQTVSVMGQEFSNSFDLTDVGTRIGGKATEEGDLKITFKNHSIKVKADMGPVGKYNYDSTTDEREKGSALSKSMNPVFEAMTGAEVRTTLTPRGNVKTVEGYKEIMQAALQDNPLAKTMMESIDKNFEQSLADSFPHMPEQPVRVGDKWDQEYKMDLKGLGETAGTRHYTVESITEKDGATLVKLGVTQELTFDLEVKQGPATVTGKLKITDSKGELVFNATAGNVQSSSTEFTIAGDLVTAVNGQNINTGIEQKMSSKYQQLENLPK